MRILLVEDDDLLCQILTNHLTTQHYVVDVAADGQTGLDYAQAVTYDLIVLDVNLPRLDGIRLCQLLRQNRSTVPILLLTARGDSSDKVTGLDAGADDYVVKPCTVEEISARIRALLRRPSRVSTPVLNWGNLCLNPGTCEVTCNGQLLALSPKEYSLLELFLRNPQRTFSSSTILEHLWSFGDTPGEETIRSHIKRLRRKLKPFGNEGMIDTVYGMGYRLTPLPPPSTPPNASPPPLPSSPTSQEVARSAAIAAWEKFKQPTLERVALLDQAVLALDTGTLPTDVRQAAAQAAHKLAGSLALFGFPAGTHLGRQLETLLQHPLTSTVAEQLKAMISELHRMLDQPPQFPQPVSPLPAPPLPASASDRLEVPAIRQPVSPLPEHDGVQVLVIGSDIALAERLLAEASQREIEVKRVADLRAARLQLTQHVPDLILLDQLAVEETPDDMTSTELRHEFPALPIVLFTDRDDFDQRLAGVRRGCDRIIPKSTPLPELLTELQGVLQQTVLPPIRVLAVDDDPLVLECLSQFLPTQGILLTPLNHPDAVWPCLTATHPDLLILDMEMPAINGLELCRVIRSDRVWATLPILFLTACREPDIVRQIFEAGADDYISKPFTELEVVTRIFNRLKRNRLLQHAG